MKINSITKLQPEITVDIEVSETHTYQLSNGVVSHNTVSQLTDTASGIHPRYSDFYIRRVRLSINDPLSTFMKDKGFPYEIDAYDPSTCVMSFPMKAPEGAVTRNMFNCIEQLELWKIYQEFWCEHKPSITVYYHDTEFFKLGDWVYKNFDILSGVSFLRSE